MSSRTAAGLSQRRMRKPFAGCANPAHRGPLAGQPGPHLAAEELPQGVAPSPPRRGEGGWGGDFPRAESQASQQRERPCRTACAVLRPQRSAWLTQGYVTRLTALSRAAAPA